MRKIFLSLVAVLGCFMLMAQTPVKKVSFGAEVDALPFATGGYLGAVWAGKDHFRIRVLNAEVNKPDWSTTKGFANHHVNAYAVVADYFLKNNWKGWWMGAGLVYWKSSIQTDALLQRARFSNYLLNGSIGYNINLYKQLYLSPWGGLSLRAAGDKNVAVDTKTYTLPFFNPEASLKLGIRF
ncbi:MAG: hypothetical protein U0T11_02355 [Chitinophagaceae bacterium]